MNMYVAVVGFFLHITCVRCTQTHARTHAHMYISSLYALLKVWQNFEMMKMCSLPNWRRSKTKRAYSDTHTLTKTCMVHQLHLLRCNLRKCDFNMHGRLWQSDYILSHVYRISHVTMNAVVISSHLIWTLWCWCCCWLSSKSNSLLLWYNNTKYIVVVVVVIRVAKFGISVSTF